MLYAQSDFSMLAKEQPRARGVLNICTHVYGLFDAAIFFMVLLVIFVFNLQQSGRGLALPRRTFRWLLLLIVLAELLQHGVIFLH
jgi:hypothetical protein